MAQADEYEAYHSISQTSPESISCWDSLVSVFSNCFGNKVATVTMDGNTFTLSKLIAEGGFSFVYIATSPQLKQQEFAVKKMIIQMHEQLEAAQWEIQVMEELLLPLKKQRQQNQQSTDDSEIKRKSSRSKSRHDDDEKAIPLTEDVDNMANVSASSLMRRQNSGNEYILPLLHHTIARHDRIPEFKLVYMVFPFCKRGNLVSYMQDMRDNGQMYMDEIYMFTMFRKICMAVYALHCHEPTWAHNDIKLDNILVTESDDPYLMDFGSVSEARHAINSRKEALLAQEWAQRNMTGAYTPPEYFDCPSKFKFDERTDVWALGCLLFAMAFGYSPFHCEETGSNALAVLGGSVTFPEKHPYSDGFVKIVKWLINPKLKHRPFVPAIIESVSDVLSDLNSNT